MFFKENTEADGKFAMKICTSAFQEYFWLNKVQTSENLLNFKIYCDVII